MGTVYSTPNRKAWEDCVGGGGGVETKKHIADELGCNKHAGSATARRMPAFVVPTLLRRGNKSGAPRQDAYRKGTWPGCYISLLIALNWQ